MRIRLVFANPSQIAVVITNFMHSDGSFFFLTL